MASPSRVYEAFISALQSGATTAEATRIANSIGGRKPAAQAAADLPLPTEADVRAMDAEALRKFLTAEAVAFAEGADEDEMRAIALEVIGVPTTPAPKPLTRESIEAMEKDELLELLHAHGAEPDGRLGAPKLRQQAIDLIFVE